MLYNNKFVNITGDNSIHFPKADPLSVPRMEIYVEGGIHINITDSEIIGLKEADIKSIE